MANQMLIRIEETLKDRFEKIVRNEGKSMSQKVRELIEGYVNDHDIGSYIDDLWGRIGADLKKQKKTTQDIQRAIDQARSGT